MRVEAKDLEEALIEASKNLDCSVIDLEYTIVQLPKKGFLGFGCRNIIIEVENKKKQVKKHSKNNFQISKIREKNSCEKVEEKKENIKNDKIENVKPKESYVVKEDKIFDSFHRESKDTRNMQNILDEIKIQLEKLLNSTCFDISLKELKMYNEESVFIHLDGEDAALLIGKEAHRYKAISYLLHSWINTRYNLLVRLEISHFLEDQIQGMQGYLQSIVEKIKIYGSGQTKPLDGVLIKIALERLRSEFPHKYVGIKQNNDQRFIVINDFLKKDE
ncbi:Jag N-terminal domain-containing protein [Campylobacter molothri]|uniref:Jag N-terminal domain-containing protein n=1 Tax=Campylobacter molothri TaxID=1032242 RepID=UPI001EB76B91|nr:Jag N-terminal domain-containing protein [Campylobacter sp. RM10535]